VSELLEAALTWAEAGRPVFPVGFDKRPLNGSNGLLDATTDRERIERFWRAHPETNMAVRTGRPSGLVVLDVDGQEGADSLHELELEYGALPETGSVVTPRGGQHFYFQWPGIPIKTLAGIRPGIDIRGDGGYVLVPPSRTRDGAYEYDTEAPAAPTPQWLVELTRDRPDGEQPATPPPVWVSMLRDGLEHGTRNTGLARLTGHLLRRWIDVDLTREIVHLVNEQRCRPPLSRREVQRIFDSVAGREAERLRRRNR
jgi:Bifunctional DNA primase/polymerase, N-terminal/Primase C terminal 1 (PriCT-1)